MTDLLYLLAFSMVLFIINIIGLFSTRKAKLISGQIISQADTILKGEKE